MKALILMTRIPYRGNTKTRLMPVLKPIQCEELHWAFLEDYYTCFESIDDDIDVFVAYAPENQSDTFLTSVPTNYECFKQRGSNLGFRMLNAFQDVFDKGYEKVVLVGCDIPQMERKTYINAYKELDHVDMVICPTYDGGYCLMGLKKNHERLFINDVKWGNQTVVEQTFSMANQIGLSVRLLDKYRDVDEYDDLISLLDLYEDPFRTFDHIPRATLQYIYLLREEKVI